MLALLLLWLLGRGAPVAAASAPPPPPKPQDLVSNWNAGCTFNLTGRGPRLGFPFCNSSLPLEVRLQDLLGRMTAAEKSSNLHDGVPRLGVPVFSASEDTHGIGCGCAPPITNSTEADGIGVGLGSGSGCPTTFPNGPSLGASFDRKLWASIGRTIGLEARGLTNQGHCTLYFLDPNINLLRDPRWGRAQEIPGEDPYLTSEYGSHIIAATQQPGDDPRYLAAASTMKHFAIYDFEGIAPWGTDQYPKMPAGEFATPSTASCDGATQSPTDGHIWARGHCSRMNIDAYPPARDFAGYYMKAFEIVSQRANPSAIMCSYNSQYGVPSCAHPINNALVRQQWGWDGFFISDCNAIEHFCSHNYTGCASTNGSFANCASGPNVYAALVQGGIDYNCGDFYRNQLLNQVNSGAINQSDVDRAVSRVLRTMFKLGMFDEVEGNLYASLGPEIVDRPEAREQALLAAEEGSVLLKNDGILPLKVSASAVRNSGGDEFRPTQKLAFIGPQLNFTQDMLSAPQYHGQNTLVNSHSPLLVAQRRGWQVTFSHGCNICDKRPPGYPNFPCQVKDSEADRSNFSAAEAVAKASDVAILFLGNDQTTEAENFDRYSLGLPGAQQDLLEAVAKVQPNVVLVLQNGGPIAVDWAVSSPRVRAILDVFQPGELGGDAILNLLTGSAVPSGKLPYTMYTEAFAASRSVDASSGGKCGTGDCGARHPMETDLRAQGGVTSWWSTQPALYDFGFGLSYTNFTYKWSNTPPASSTVDIAEFAEHYDYHASVHGHSSLDNATALLPPDVMHSVTVSNTGSRVADCVVLAFVTSTANSNDDTPLKKLFGFERLSKVAPGEARSVSFASGPAELANYDYRGALVLRPGQVGIEVGDVVSPARRLLALEGEDAVLRAPIKVTI